MAGSTLTLTQAVFPEAKAASRAGRTSSGRSTQMPKPPRASHHLMVIDPSQVGPVRNGMSHAQLLTVQDHPPGLVVADHDDDGQLLADSRVKLHKVEADGSIARYEQDASVGMQELGCIGIGDTDGKAAVEAVIQIGATTTNGAASSPSTWTYPRRLRRRISSSRIHEIVDLPGQTDRMHGQRLARPHAICLRLPILMELADAGKPRCEPLTQSGGLAVLIDGKTQLLQERLDVTDNAQIDGTVPSRFPPRRCPPG